MKKLILFLSILLLQGKTFGQVLSLDSIFAAIDKSQPELRMYDAQIKAYDEYARGAKALDPPQVGAGFFMTPYNPMMWRSDEMTGEPGMGSFMISAQQMIMNPRKLNANAAYMQSMSAIEKEMKGATRNELYSMAKMWFNEWVVLKRKLQVLNESEILLNYIIKSAEIRYTYGMEKLNGYYKAKAMLGDILNMKLMTEQMIKQQRIKLNTVMNRDKNLQFEIDTVVSLKNYENEAIDTARISTVRSDFRAFSQNINFLKSKQLYEQSKRLPDFGIKYDHMVGFGNQPQLFSVMAMVSIPIVPWSSRMYRSSAKGLNFEMEAIKERQQAFLNQTAGNIADLVQQMRSKKEQLALYEKNILPALRKNYQTTLLAYEQNTEELFMVLDAWQNLKMIQLAYYDLLRELMLLQVEFEKQMEIK